MTIRRAYSLLTIKAVDPELRQIEGLATTPQLDHIGDIVEPLGGEFRFPVPLVWQHKHDQPVGQVIAAKAGADGIRIRGQIAQIDEAGELKNLVDKAWQAVKAGLVRGLSIGFSSLKSEPLKSGGRRFVRWALLEISLSRFRPTATPRSSR
jgi:uncharacterized protein